MGEGRSHWPCTGPVPGSEIKPPLRTLRACAREHPAFLLKPRLRPSQLAGGTLGGVWLGLLSGGLSAPCLWPRGHAGVMPLGLGTPDGNSLLPLCSGFLRASRKPNYILFSNESPAEHKGPTLDGPG